MALKNTDNTKDPLIASVSGETRQKIKKGDGLADIMVKSSGSYRDKKDKAEENKYLLTGQDKYRKPGNERGTRAEGYHPYAKARNIRATGLGELASKRMIEGEGIGASLKGAIYDKFQAKKMQFKEFKDPMNLVKMLTGGGKSGFSKFMTSAAGRLRNRSAHDIEYFSGVKAPTAKKIPKLESSTEPTSSGKSTKGGKGGDNSNILNKIYQVLTESIKKAEMAKDFDKENKAEEQKDRDKKHKELIDALKGITGKSAPAEEKKGGGLLGLLGLAAGVILSKLKDIFGPVLKFVTNIGSKILGGLANLAKDLWNGVKNIGNKIFGKTPETPKPKTDAKGRARDAKGRFTKVPEATKVEPSMASKAGGAIKNVGKTIAKGAKSVTGAVGKTASKVASTTLKGAGKLLGFLKGIPGLGILAAGAGLIMEIQDLKSQLEAKTITDAEFKKGVARAVGGAAGGAGGAALLGTLGAAAGSIVPGVGTLIGGIGGGVLGYMGGDAVGGFLGEKLYDYFVNGKKETASAVKGKPKTSSPVPTASGTGSTSATSASTSIPKAATPQATVPATGGRLDAASKQNADVKSAVSSPILINKPTTVNNNVNSSTTTGGGGQIGVRNDDSTLMRMQYGSIRAV